MTELEKIAYAKSFIDKLANGINPLDDTPIPDDDIANNVRLSRCFFYVSDILRQVIENGEKQSEPKPKRVPFAITQEQIEKYEFSETPICSSILLINSSSGFNSSPVDVSFILLLLTKASALSI